MKNSLFFIVQRLLVIIIFASINLYGMQPKGPHRNLVWADNWCWMDAALHCLAANGVLVAKLEKEQNNFSKSPWVKELYRVLSAIRNVNGDIPQDLKDHKKGQRKLILKNFIN